MVIWTPKGEVLDRIDSLLIYNTHVCVSPDGALVAACGFTPDVKFWHVGFNKVIQSFISFFENWLSMANLGKITDRVRKNLDHFKCMILLK